MRSSFKEMYIEIMEASAKRSSCAKANVGCVLVKDNRIIALGYNGSSANTLNCNEVPNGELLCGKDQNGSCFNGIHAEQNAIAYCAKEGKSLKGCEIYITMNPCLSCAKLIVASGIKKVFYQTDYRISEGLTYLTKNNIPYEKL